MKRKLYFLTEANQSIGRGHLSRCLAIAETIKDLFRIAFVFRIIDKEYVESIKTSFDTQYIRNENDFVSKLVKEDIVWMDSYSFSESYKAKLHDKIFKLIETNDLPYKVKSTDIIFNQTPGIDETHFFGSNPSTQFYLGLRYTLLRKSFLNEAVNKTPPIKGKGIFICFGGADTLNLGLTFVQLLIEKKFKENIYWVTSTPDVKESNFPENVSLLYGLNELEMIEFMQKSKILLIPSSVLSFEGIALRKPIFTGYFVENQRLITEGLILKNLASGGKDFRIEKNLRNYTTEILSFYDDEQTQRGQISQQLLNLDGRSKIRIRKILSELI